MRLTELQKYAMKLCDKHGWHAESLESRLNYLNSEILEARDDIRSFDQALTSADREKAKEALGSELFDILWNVAELANRYGIDLDEAAQRKMGYNENRVFSEKPKNIQELSYRL